MFGLSQQQQGFFFKAFIYFSSTAAVNGNLYGVA